MKATLLCLGATIVAAGCGGDAKPSVAADTLSTRARQEAIGKSGLPGATGINKALDIADSAAVRAATFDSLSR
ncbi:MAG: hypothetical protein FJ206_10350 [Gemmatimonadetes bacterium]|nr:hypothetical protein [Gemmatimonadota bacterium]